MIENIFHKRLSQGLSDGSENFLNHLRVGSASDMNEDSFVGILVQRDKLLFDIFQRFFVITTACVIGERNV